MTQTATGDTGMVDPSVLLQDEHRKPYSKYETMHGLEHRQSWPTDTKAVVLQTVRKRNFKFFETQPALGAPESARTRIPLMEPTQDTPQKNGEGWILQDPAPGQSVFERRDGPSTDWLKVPPQIPEGDRPVRQAQPLEDPFPPQGPALEIMDMLDRAYLGERAMRAGKSGQDRVGFTGLV